MAPKKFDMTYKKKVGISYMHYGVLIFAQGSWRERDKEFVMQIVRNHKRDLPNLYRSDSPTSCDVCIQIHDIFNEIKGKNDGILYTTHQLFLETKEMILITNLMLDDNNDKVKKIYIFQGGPVKRAERLKINLSERLSNKNVTRADFLKILEEGKFEEEVIYEVIRKKYYSRCYYSRYNDAKDGWLGSI